MSIRPTIRDVAERAGVSTATVSFVLNDNPNEAISPRVRQRVWEVARALNYQASAAASGLKRKRTRNVALIFYKEDDAIANQFYSFVVQGAILEAIENDYNLLFSYIEGTYTGFDDLPKIIREKNAEGVLFVRHTDPKMIKDIQSLGIPIVAVDNQPLIESINSTQIDNQRGGLLAAQHLLLLGHRQLACLIPVHASPSLTDRMQGFRLGLERHGLTFNAARHVLHAASLTFEAAFETARALFAKSRVPSAIFCGNDELAAGVLRAAHEAKRHLPNELSVIGFDDIRMSRYTDPPLTTVGVDKECLGRRAMARVLELVEGSDDIIKTERVPVALIVRGSTARVKRRSTPLNNARPS
jgi:LacI family repressor for deo operon, udp, cdd, tsx, nupC, and nupG